MLMGFTLRPPWVGNATEASHLNCDPLELHIDPQTGFHTIGEGSLGGKAKGLAILCGLLGDDSPLQKAYPEVEMLLPHTLVITSSGFEAFLQENRLEGLAQDRLPDREVAARFLAGRLPVGLKAALENYLTQVTWPLAVRSSGLLEDDRQHAYAGLYRTYMLSNHHIRPSRRLACLSQAVKLVYASTFYEGPRAYARRVGHAVEAGRMAVIVQQAVGMQSGSYYYPSISGVAQSRNHYPFGGMKPQDGVATIALGLGQQVVAGERALRFCPKFPKRLPQRATVDDILAYAQRRFYAIDCNAQTPLTIDGNGHMVRRQVGDAVDEHAVQALAGTYVLAEHRVRDTMHIEGTRVLTFANVLKYDLFPLSPILRDLLPLGKKMMDAPVEIEFAVNLAAANQSRPQFYLLQMRVMSSHAAGTAVEITPDDQHRAVCVTRHALGNIDGQTINDIVFVKPEAFDPGRTRDMAQQVAAINSELTRQQRPYLLVGPGRWGSADPWLGIPVRWADISNVAAIVETYDEKLNVEPSQGAHFFHNLSSLGISYLSVTRNDGDRFDWTWLTGRERSMEKSFVAHLQLDEPVTLKVDGRSSSGVIMASEP